MSSSDETKEKGRDEFWRNRKINKAQGYCYTSFKEIKGSRNFTVAPKVFYYGRYVEIAVRSLLC